MTGVQDAGQVRDGPGRPRTRSFNALPQNLLNMFYYAPWVAEIRKNIKDKLHS